MLAIFQRNLFLISKTAPSLASRITSQLPLKVVAPVLRLNLKSLAGSNSVAVVWASFGHD
jgi:hypothetical protein